jgi:hypothetical protein
MIAVKVGATTRELTVVAAVVRAELFATTAVARIFRVNEPVLTASASRVVTRLNALVALELSTSTRCATTSTVYRTLTPVVDNSSIFARSSFDGVGFILAPLLDGLGITTSVTLVMVIWAGSSPITNAATVIRNALSALGSARNCAAVQLTRV